MRIVYPGETVAPNVCVICKLSVADDRPFVDTLYSFDPDYGSFLTGVTYVCVPCVRTLAEVVGLVDGAPLEHQNAELRQENAILREKHLEDVDSVIAAVRERMMPAKKAVSA